MSTRLLLDGEDLPALMLRVRAEMGPEARIVKAERIRTGGIAGFFAREHFELTVEVPDTRRAGRARRRPAAVATSGETIREVVPGDVTGLAALLAAADAAEREGLAGPDGAGSGAATASTELPFHPAAQVSTAGDTFARVLQSMREIVGPIAEPVVEDAPAPVPVIPVALVEVAPAPTVPAPDEVTPDEVTPDEAPSLTAPPALFAPDPVAVGGATQLERPRCSVSTLLELGIPTRLLAGFTDPDTAVPLSLLVRGFESVPRLRLAPGTVVAVVGERSDALRTATQMAHRSGMDPHEIVLAGDIDPIAGHGRRLQTAGAVARYRARASRDVPALVVIGVDQSRETFVEPAALLEALDPDEAWAVLDARCKSVELRRWLRGVGARRPFDAVAAVRTFDAQAPGTVLNLGTPVGWVDGLPASPVVWASVLSERLADDVRWD